MKSIDVPVLRTLLARRTGLDLGRGGMEAHLIAFVEKRMVESDLSFERYLEQVEIPGSEELRLLTETMTVVYTWFFRDPGQFSVVEQLMRDFPCDRSMGIWIAGCATGEEAYSVALVAAELGRRVDVLGTDLNSNALRIADAGRYAASSLSAVDVDLRRRYLGGCIDQFAIPTHVKQNVRFQIGNLIDAAPRARAAEGWDLVLCRNVLIYFGAEQARRTLDALAASLAPGGTLILGASEAILERPTLLRVTGVAGRAVLVRPRSGDSRQSVAPVPINRAPEPQIRCRSTSASFPLAIGANGEPPIAGATSGTIAACGPTRALASAVFDSERMASPGTVQSVIERGHAALSVGEIPVARGAYLQALKMDPTCSDAMMYAGIAYYLDGDFDSALSQLRAALCLDPTLWAACFYQALCYENMGFAEDAARSFSLVVKLASEPQALGGYPTFLQAWQHDLLAVARQRSHRAALPRDSRASNRMLSGVRR